MIVQEFRKEKELLEVMQKIGGMQKLNVGVTDRIGLSDSIFLAKSSIIDLFKDLLQEKRGFI